MTQNQHKNKHEYHQGKNEQKTGTPPSKDIFSFKKHSMDYFTSNGVMLRTGYRDQKYWYTLCIKELLDNGVDFLWKYYQGYSNTSVTVYVTKDDSLLHIKIRNSNSHNIQVFQNIDLIFDTEMRYGSKQNEKIISRGMLGDAMKQLLGLSYVLIHDKDDGTAFSNEQWNQPLIIRCNGKETHVRVIVDKSSQTAELEIKDIGLVGHTDTEIEVFLPIIQDLDIHELEKFCRIYPLLTTDISFKFRLVDNSTDQEKPSTEVLEEAAITSPTAAKKLQESLIQILSNPERKAAIKIEYPALHPISTKWNNISSTHWLLPDEFVTWFTSVYDKKTTTVYDILQKFREGNRIKKTTENQISIAEFLLNPDYPKKLEQLYHEARNVLQQPKELSLPYSNNKERKQALISRVCNLYPDLLDTEKAIHKLIPGCYNDDKQRKVWAPDGEHYSYHPGNGILHYPFVIEIISIPYKTTLLNDTEKASVFIGSINYSTSPRSNEFEGEYGWDDKHDYFVTSSSMLDVLKTLGFRFSEDSDSKVKIPSIIIVNIVSPRVDYHGHDKSRIDTHAFHDRLVEAAKKISDSTQTFRAAGFVFTRQHQHDRIPDNRSVITAESLVEELLRKRMETI